MNGSSRGARQHGSTRGDWRWLSAAVCRMLPDRTHARTPLLSAYDVGELNGTPRAWRRAQGTPVFYIERRGFPEETVRIW